jgi:hypothetical protein
VNARARGLDLGAGESFEHRVVLHVTTRELNLSCAPRRRELMALAG